MSIVKLLLAKVHLRVDGDEDDVLIKLLLDAAEEQAFEFMDRKVYATQVEADADTESDRPIAINASITAACLLTLGHLYANREENVTGTIVSELKTGVQALLTPYRINMGV